MRGFLEYFARRSFLARIMTILVLMVGAGSLSIINLQEYPDVAFAEVEITTLYPGASAQDIELNITNKIEKELKSVEGMKKYNSKSFDGQSYINIELDESYDIDKTVRDIQKAVDRVQGLPKDITNPPLVEQKSTSSLEVMTFGVVTSQSNAELQKYSRDLEKRLRGVAGVGKVSMSGFTEREFWIEVDPTKVARYQMTIDEVINAINTRNLSLSGGVVESWSSEQRVVTLNQVASTSELADSIIKVLPSGEMVRLHDLATVSDSFEKATKLGMVNGRNAIVFTVNKSANADIVSTIDRIKSLLDTESELLDGMYEFPISLDLSKDMDDKFSIVTANGGTGLVLVLLVLSLILKRRIAFWVSVSIPFCILGVIAVVPAFGMNLDSITLAALLLVIGIIVDDSVIVAESIYQEREKGKEAIEATVSGTKKVIVPIIASLTTTALVFIPMMFIPGTMGKAIAVIPVTVITALFFSLFECIFTLPAHLANSLEKEKQNQAKSDWFVPVIQSYEKFLSSCLEWKKVVISVAVTALVIGGYAASTLKIDIFPSETAKYIEVHTEVEPGTPLDLVRSAHQELEDRVFDLYDRGLVAFQMTYGSPVSTGLITLTNYEERKETANAISDYLNESMKGSESIDFIKFTVDAGGPPPGEPLEVRVISSNTEEREEAVELVMAWMQKHDGLDKVSNNEVLTDPQLQIIPQYEWLARYGLTVQDLATTLRVAFDGDNVTSTWIGDQEVDIRVLLDKQYRNIDKLKTTKIYMPNGATVPLSRLAKIKKIDAPREILHYRGDRQVVVNSQITDDNISSSEISQALLDGLLPKIGGTVRLEIGGEAESTSETMSGFVVAFPMAIVGIYFVLAIMFGSLLQPLMIMVVIPFAVVAALLALFVHMQPISLFALIGVLGMTGVVVNNSLVLINRINELKEKEGVLGAVIKAAGSRFRPIILTSITTVVGLVPLAYGIGGTDSYMGPMSLTLGYGLLFSLPIVLVVTPCIYYACFGRMNKR
ncbi:efflux RND transporter permease subunit [Vibrio rotiferianus]|uniref:efflux RND transporter permease subunit n=1 Tax=Vibrio rotiferianus TaxID=190895 RepID=UPI00406A13F5